MDNRAIGVFDSGLGGLTCVKEIMELLPNEEVIYFGDTGRVPYGTRSPETIIKYVESDINFLKTFNIKMIVIACGTASSIALETVKRRFDIPIIGVVDPAVKAALATGKDSIGVIGTPGTINSGKYLQKIKQLKPQTLVTSVACPLFVPLVENGYIKHKATYLIAEEYLRVLKSAKADTVILGCTHYPLLKDVISQVMGMGVKLIDPGYETAFEVKDYLTKNDMLNEMKHDKPYRFYVSDSVEGFERLGGKFLQKEITGLVERIDIEKYTEERHMRITVKVKSEKQGENVNMFTAEGSFYEREGVKYISYSEPGLDGTTTTLKIYDDAITMLRYGENGMKIEFRKGVKTSTRYNTPYGSFEMEVMPERVHSKIGSDTGEVFLMYSMDFAGEKSDNKYKLDFKIQEG